MLISSSKSKLTRLTESYLLRPSGEPGYLYTRVMLNGTLTVEADFTGHFDQHFRGYNLILDQDEIMIALFVLQAEPGYQRTCDAWRKFYTSKDLLSKDAQPYSSSLEVLDMSLADVERTKLEDLQLLIDELDNIEDDAPDALKQIKTIAENNSLMPVGD